MWEVVKERPSARLRAAIGKERPLVVPGAYDSLSAKILASVGFDTIYLSSLGTALAHAGLPDTGLLNATEQALVARHVAESVTSAVIVDGDDGHGNAINAMRTVRSLITAGAAGIEINDQASPSR